MSEWEYLLKRIIWLQLGDIHGKRILDFGSGMGSTANYLAKKNDVTAIEPSAESISKRYTENEYKQILGNIDELRKLENELFDVIICHNVLEYAMEREEIIQEFYRLLKPNGILSIVKHNRAGRIMLATVLLNDFETANRLLNGEDTEVSQYGRIHYYNDEELIKWCNGFQIRKTYGIRTFWDLQQNQEIHKDINWQEKMIQIEMKVSEIEEFRSISHFHHLLLKK